MAKPQKTIPDKKPFNWGLFWASIAAICGIIVVIFYYVHLVNENNYLSSRISSLESENKALQARFENLLSLYRTLVADLVKDGKISIEDIKNFLPLSESSALQHLVPKSPSNFDNPLFNGPQRFPLRNDQSSIPKKSIK